MQSPQAATLVSAPLTGYAAIHVADVEEPLTSAGRQEAETDTADVTHSRAASSLLDSSTSHIAVYEDPFHDPAPPDPPIPPVPPLPSRVLEGRAILEKHSRAIRAARPRPTAPRDSPEDSSRDKVQAHNRQEARQSGKRYAADGGISLARGRESTHTVRTVPDAHSMHSSSTMPPPYAEYD